MRQEKSPDYLEEIEFPGSVPESSSRKYDNDLGSLEAEESSPIDYVNDTESPGVAKEQHPARLPAALSEIPPESTIISTSTSTTTSGSDGWETVMLPFSSFVRTNHGFVVEPQTSLGKQRVKSIGIGLTDRVDGPFDLRIHKIWATNGMGEADIEEERRICAGNALPVDEGVLSGWAENDKQTSANKESRQQRKQGPQEKGLKGLKWEE